MSTPLSNGPFTGLSHSWTMMRRCLWWETSDRRSTHATNGAFGGHTLRKPCCRQDINWLVQLTQQALCVAGWTGRRRTKEVMARTENVPFPHLASTEVWGTKG
ncbi:hypothetical protein BDDG_01985 [Blastomyces dermatitidis ATCC 18188]|uniref:Uncharacterized protein n=1 Tax=Ajellomyces dermatitidis (strain ATCC 18188 / CBS 674.68) TaxID=653446 RepID=F2T734_AJEDA|nr:hypothetical protein BDDG_01985 [Blastomyces dermatitidis ATCC 18188]